MDTFGFGLTRAAQIPALFAGMLGLNANLTLDQFDEVAELALADFPGLAFVGLNLYLTYGHTRVLIACGARAGLPLPPAAPVGPVSRVCTILCCSRRRVCAVRPSGRRGRRG